MYAAWNTLDTVAAVAQLGVEAGCEFDINTAAPLTLYSTTLRDLSAASPHHPALLRGFAVLSATACGQEPLR